MAKRYEELLKYVRRVKPSTITEIGTWNGDRAIAMAKEALKHNTVVRYTGFSLFEDGTNETDAEEFNVKEHVSLEAVTAKLEAFAKDHDGFSFHLIKGNTRYTLKKRIIFNDFAFIDGGHSVETINSDYQALAGCKFIVFDDFYSGKNPNVDIRKVGCNVLVASLMGEGKNVSIVPPRDKVKGGGFVQLAVLDNR